MVLRHRKSMAARETRTTCLKCMHADNRKDPFEAESACEKCKGDLEPNQSRMLDNDYQCALRHAIFMEVLRRRNDAYVAHIIVRCTVAHVPLCFMRRFTA